MPEILLSHEGPVARVIIFYPERHNALTYAMLLQLPGDFEELGNAPATPAILAGEVNMTFDSLVGPLPNTRADELRALAFTGKQRAAVPPEVPAVLPTS